MSRRVPLGSALFVAFVSCTLLPQALLPRDARAAIPNEDASTRFERLSRDPLLERWQQDFFARRLQEIRSGAAPLALRQPIAAPLAAVADPPDHNRVLFYGGYPISGYDLNGLVWALSLGSLPLDVPAVGRTGNPGVMLATCPNPGRGRLRLKLATRATGPARVDVVDIAGRTIYARDLGTLAAGEHDLDLGSGVTFSPGLYFVTYVGDGTRVSARTVVVQ